MWSNQFKSLPNQSKFHNEVRDIFRNDPWWKRISCWQEVPVWELIPEYRNRLHRFDWYIETLNTVLELHGAQHYKPVAFGEMSFDDKMFDFKASQIRDRAKESAARNAGFQYIVISYREQSRLTGEYLKQQIIGGVS